MYGAVILLFFYLLGQLLFPLKSVSGFWLAKIFFAPKIAVKTIFEKNLAQSRLLELQLENASLRAQLQALKMQPTLLGEGKNLLSASIFSSYPFTNFADIFVNAGTEDGVREGYPVFAKEGVFLGVVSQSQEGKSRIKTIFTSGWELPVQIGADRVDALLIGSHEPTLTLISKNKPIAGGESVFLVSPDFPFGLTIGRVLHVSQRSDELFLEANLELPYKLSELKTAYIQLP